MCVYVCVCSSLTALCALMTDRSLQRVALFTCLGYTRAANGSAHVGFTPLVPACSSCECWPWRGFCPLKMPGPLHAGPFMNGQIPELHANEAGRREGRPQAAAVPGSASILFYLWTAVPGAEQITWDSSRAGGGREDAPGERGLKQVSTLMGLI